jgi:hypothetical protein
MAGILDSQNYLSMRASPRAVVKQHVHINLDEEV